MGTDKPIISEAANTAAEQALRIRALNDALRTTFRGGSVFLTRGIETLSPSQRVAIVAAVRVFGAFDENNDPWGEHDCATLTVDGHEVMFKIDYYNTSMELASPDPSDASVTRRVLTILFTHEY
jgi:Protein of unknown function (DUF3768)